MNKNVKKSQGRKSSNIESTKEELRQRDLYWNLNDRIDTLSKRIDTTYDRFWETEKILDRLKRMTIFSECIPVIPFKTNKLTEKEISQIKLMRNALQNFLDNFKKSNKLIKLKDYRRRR